MPCNRMTWTSTTRRWTYVMSRTGRKRPNGSSPAPRSWPGRSNPRGGCRPSFYLDLAECCFKRRQAEVGDDYVRRAERAAVGDADGLVDVGLFYLDRDQEGRAVAFFDQALRLDPGHGWANYHVGA